MMIQAGFGIADMTPEVGKHIPGGFSPRVSTGVLDPLQARACVVTASGETVAVVGVDAVSLRFDTVAAARAHIQAACGIPERNVTIAASHTHSGGPANDVLGTDSDDQYCDQVASAIASAVVAAQANLTEVEMACGAADCDGWAFNRRFKMRDGREATNPGKGNADMIEPAGPVDPHVGVIGFREPGGRWLGAIANFVCHCTVVGGAQFSGDYPAYWQRALHSEIDPDFTLVFLSGACGDINQLDFTNTEVRESGREWAEKMALALARNTVEALQGAESATTVKIAVAHGQVEVGYRRPTAEDLAAARKLVASDGAWTSDKWRARDVILLSEAIGEAATTICPVDVTRIGPAAICAAPWQPFCEFGLSIKRGSPCSPTLVAAFANGMLGYVPTPQGFAGGGYEPTLCRGSKLQPDAGGYIVAETLRLLKTLA